MPKVKYITYIIGKYLGRFLTLDEAIKVRDEYMILTSKEDFENAILKGEKNKTSTVFYTGELAEETPEIGAVIEKGGQKGIYIGEADNGPVIVDLHDASKTMTWDEAKEYAHKEGKRLPSQRELMLMFVHQEKLNSALKKHEGKAWKRGWYWSSSEYDDYGAWGVGANSGGVNYRNKHGDYVYVRCVLAF